MRWAWNGPAVPSGAMHGLISVLSSLRQRSHALSPRPNAGSTPFAALRSNSTTVASRLSAFTPIFAASSRSVGALAPSTFSTCLPRLSMSVSDSASGRLLMVYAGRLAN